MELSAIMMPKSALQLRLTQYRYLNSRRASLIDVKHHYYENSVLCIPSHIDPVHEAQQLAQHLIRSQKLKFSFKTLFYLDNILRTFLTQCAA